MLYWKWQKIVSRKEAIESSTHRSWCEFQCFLPFFFPTYVLPAPISRSSWPPWSLRASTPVPAPRSPAVPTPGARASPFLRSAALISRPRPAGATAGPTRPRRRRARALRTFPAPSPQNMKNNTLAAKNRREGQLFSLWHLSRKTRNIRPKSCLPQRS